MSDINIKYKDDIIAEAPDGGTCHLFTKDKYCEDDIKIEYQPRHRIYELSFSNVQQKEVFLVSLDEETRSHMYDATYMVSLRRIDLEVPSTSPVVVELFAGTKELGWMEAAGGYVHGGLLNTSNAQGGLSTNIIYRTPADTGTTSGAGGNFRMKGNDLYYYQSSATRKFDGTYLLTLTW